MTNNKQSCLPIAKDGKAVGEIVSINKAQRLRVVLGVCLVLMFGNVLYGLLDGEVSGLARRVITTYLLLYPIYDVPDYYKTAQRDVSAVVRLLFE